jgi:FkbM family methyltransferase
MAGVPPEPPSDVKRDVRISGQTFSVVVSRSNAAEFWDHAAAGGWEDDTLAFVRAHVRPSTTFVDIGAWIGPVSLFASRFAARVLAIEPDPVAHGDLERNIALNPRPEGQGAVDVWFVGVDNAPGELVLFAPGELGGSITSSIPVEGGIKVRVRTVSFADIDARIGNARDVVVKVDIEGHEYQVVEQLAQFIARHRAPLHLSLHPRGYFERVERERGYVAAKVATWRATRQVLRTLGAVGVVNQPGLGVPFTAGSLARRIFLRRRAKNFTVEVVPAVVGEA